MTALRVKLGITLALTVVLGACQTEPFDYTAYREHFPASILVLPPLDETVEVQAQSAYLSTVTQPLAERGYYVFPVAVVQRMMQENGLPTPEEMHAVSLAKIDEIFGADAVLYLRLTNWGTSYLVVDSQTEVTVAARLVDVATGAEIWSGEETAIRSSSGGSIDLIGMMAAALVNQIATSVSDPSADVARQANSHLFSNSHRGLLLGPRHPNFGVDP